ncbi:hypothetical protein P22_1431 [Propionispora sp. 2/2-37]|uniref:response regulator transcription factor n=1 Tax=Propionispora sp. 2/2-37 TaxID=1677858 RepID=UPI0006BB7B98|nr:response regulator transcription factor [Propionispora sp. 2/2-37]CUH95361.1 hypothetical protein P22_1431 [Propionispora sp. 2/2-37]
MKILLLHAETKLIDALPRLLRKNGYLVDTATDGETGAPMAFTGTYDIIILDRMLPHLDGLSLVKEFRSFGYDTPVLFLTAKNSPEERAEGLMAGADDYVGTPFSIVELLARLQALVRRKNKIIEKNILVVNDLKFNPRKNLVTKKDKQIKLTLKEGLLLEMLMRTPGQVITKEEIAEKIWGYLAETDIASVNLYIHYLRKKLCINNLITIRGIGYCLETNFKECTAN